MREDERDVLQAIVDGTVRNTGQGFFQALVRSLSLATGAESAFVAEFAGSDRRVRTLAFFQRGRLVDNAEWDLDGTPCEEVLRGKRCHYPREVSRSFPRDATLDGVESYLGVSLHGGDGKILGHLVIFDSRPMPPELRLLHTFEIFAARAAAELERLRMEQRLRESEERYRDLFEEAPIAYVHEGLDTRFLRANRAALRILGITEQDVADIIGRSFIPDTPEAQRRAQEALAAIRRGEDKNGVVLELRRRDNGRPIWIQWWSRPDPSGAYTRTMFIDITDRVLMEQEQDRLTAQNQYLQEEIKADHNFEEIIGRSPALLSALDKVKRVARTDASVLITGETGSGKELIARAVHSRSPRRERPLVKLNCAALPTGLIESELFGHEKGAFSGAIQRRIGRFELAHGGTIFLDEIGELPLDVQAKLLRVLQEREFERVGGSHTIRADVRVISATNRDLVRAVAQGRFREDLYYRLAVFPIALPPLRERKEDIPLLVQFFLQKYGARIGQHIESVDPATAKRLLDYPWPGNIRELQNIIERALILTSGPVLHIDPEMLPERSLPRGAAAPREPREPREIQAEDEVELRSGGRGQGGGSTGDLNVVQREHILAVLQRTEWVIEGEHGAARELGLHPNTLRSRMKKLGIRRP
jgi:PAS domain S-box-containing protein